MLPKGKAYFVVFVNKLLSLNQLRNEKSNELFQPCLAGVRLNFEKKDVERIINAEIDGQLVFSNYGAVSRRETGLLNPPDLADSAIQF